MSLRQSITNIANAIRSKTGKTDTMTIDEMPTEIESISGGGGDDLLAIKISGQKIPSYTYQGTTIGQYAFNRFKIGTLNIPNVTELTAGNTFGYADIDNVSFDKITKISANNIFEYFNNNIWSSQTQDPVFNFDKVRDFNPRSFNNFGGSSSVSDRYKAVIRLPILESMASFNPTNAYRIRTVYAPNCMVTSKTIVNLDRIQIMDIKGFDTVGTNTGSSANFNNCKSLITLVIRRTDRVNPAPTNANWLFDTTCYWMYGTVNITYNPNGEKGSIYVPDALVDEYKETAGWSNFADIIKPLSEYTE